MSRILAVANIKGGVGKTTTVVNLSAALAERGYRVLAIDLDPQSSLTLSMGMKPEQVSVTIRQMLDNKSDALWPIHETQEHWDFIPTNVDLRVLEHELETHPHRIPKVAAGLQALRDKYDFILLDCPASAGPLIGAALAAADQVIIPLTPDFLAFQVSRSLFRIIRAIRQNVNPRLRIAGIFLTMYDTRTRHARDFMTTIRETYDDVPFFSAVVRQSVKVKEAPSQGQSVLRYAPESQAAKAYRVIAIEIIHGIAGQQPLIGPRLPKEADNPLAPMVISNDTLTGRIPPPPRIVPPNMPPAPAVKPVFVPTNPAPPAKPTVAPVIVAQAAPANHNAAANVPAFLTRNSAPVVLTRVDGNGHHSGNNGHAPAVTQTAPRAAGQKEYTLEVAALPRLEPVREEPPADLHKAFRALARRATADSRGVVLEYELARECDHILFVSTTADVADLIQDASLLAEAGFSALAEKVFQRVTELDPTRPEGWIGWARVTLDPLARVNHLQKAIYLKPGRELRGELAIARQNLQEYAYTLLEEGTAQSDPERMAQAHQLFKHAVSIDPNDERAWLGCARTADNLVEKMSYLKRALKINPQNKDALELAAIVGSFVHDEPKERWSFKTSKKGSVLLGIVLIGLVVLFFALPWIVPLR